MWSSPTNNNPQHSDIALYSIYRPAYVVPNWPLLEQVYMFYDKKKKDSTVVPLSLKHSVLGSCLFKGTLLNSLLWLVSLHASEP